MKKILFVTGTRADFGKIKPLIVELLKNGGFDIHLFVTGMHMLSKYGYTCEEVERAKIGKLYKYINQNPNDEMDHVLAKTIIGISDYVRETMPDMLVVHGDRVETLAGAIVGALNNIIVAHIEGGEVSGTIDELIRHAVTKLAHLHFVANENAMSRVIRMGECQKTVHVIGSPDIDVMNSDTLPSIDEVRARYSFNYKNYGIVLFHPVTTEIGLMNEASKSLVQALIQSDQNYVVIYPNNDSGTKYIFDSYEALEGRARFKIYPSMRFEYFLTLLKNADFIVGNSSAGIREAPHFGTPTINIGSRQNNRGTAPTIIDTDYSYNSILSAILSIPKVNRVRTSNYGDGKSKLHFSNLLTSAEIWKTPTQKFFVDI